MEVLIYLVPIALGLGLLGLGAFMWALKTGQYEDLEGAAWRALMDDDAPAESGRANEGGTRNTTAASVSMWVSMRRTSGPPCATAPKKQRPRLGNRPCRSSARAAGLHAGNGITQPGYFSIASTNITAKV